MFLENLTASGSGAINLTGNSGANTLIGNDAANVIDGGAGADVMRGGAGDDTYVLDQAADQILDSAGTDTALVSFSYTLGTDVENLTAAAGASSLGLTGNAFNNVITGTRGNDTLDGGAGADRLVGGDGNDTYVIDNAGDRIIDTGGVNTVLTSVSFSLDAYLNHLKGMGAGSLVLSGNSADNSITGGDGADRIYGGLGRDRLAGGAGRDAFVLDTAVAKKKNANVDTITDFSVKDDSIYLENAIFKALGKKGTSLKPAKFKKDAFHLGSKAHDADDRIIYNKKKGVLYYDADGAGGAAQVQIATLSKKLKMTHKDFFVV
jgi:Ca2+-binding RTX toxin-like protein